MAVAPTFSVIVVCRNPGFRLHAALASIWSQQRVNAEVIVIDGASSDGTRGWLESERARLTVLVSEPDGGIYDAMNKGVARSSGEWIYFLGADDRLATDNTLSESAAWMKQTSAGVVAGEVAFDDGRLYRLRSSVNVLARNFVHHQAAFYRRSLFSENGGFDTSLGVMADYEFNVRLWKNRVTFKPIPLRVAACGVGGMSDAGRWQGYREEITVRHRFFPGHRCLGWDVVSVVRFLRKKFVRTFGSRHG